MPGLLLFLGLSMFYRLAPNCKVETQMVWPAALIATIVLQVVQELFVVYLSHFPITDLYGAFAGIAALMLWVYTCGIVVIWGACLCATDRSC